MTSATAERSGRASGWLSELHGRAREWVTGQRRPGDTARTEEYVDLLFAFGQARLGQRAAAEELLSRAAGALGGEDEAHQALLAAFRFRIEQALRGEPLSGPLPQDWLEGQHPADRLAAYVVDRARKQLRVLEPEQRVTVYRDWGARGGHLERALIGLDDIGDVPTFVARVNQLLRDESGGKRRSVRNRARILQQGLRGACLSTPEATRAWLTEALQLLGEESRFQSGRDEALDWTAVAASAAQAATHHGLRGELLQVARILPAALEALSRHHYLTVGEDLLRATVRGYIAFRLPDELDAFLGEMAGLLARLDSEKVERLLMMACLVEGWYAFGWDKLARPVVKDMLAALTAVAPREATRLACASARAVRTAAPEVARSHYHAVLQRARIQDTYTVASHYATAQLEVLDAIVLSAIEAFLND